MTRPAENPEADGRNYSELLGAVLGDVERLASQHADLLRAEVRHTFTGAGVAAASVGVGAGLAGAAGLLLAQMIVHRLHAATRLPLWACYGLVGTALGATGAGLMASGLQRAAAIDPIPRETLATLHENYLWLKSQAEELHP